MTIDEARKLSPREINCAITDAVPRLKTRTIEVPYKPNYLPNVITIENDFFYDLNACHEAEKTLSVEQIESYFQCFCCSNDDPKKRPMFAPANIRAIALAVVLSERKK